MTTTYYTQVLNVVGGAPTTKQRRVDIDVLPPGYAGFVQPHELRDVTPVTREYRKRPARSTANPQTGDFRT